MIILYLPFQENETGDLLPKLTSWQRSNNFYKKNTLIVKHQDNYDDEFADENVTIYICAHGSDELFDFNLYNASSNALSIDTNILAQRFECDFMSIAHKIRKIHLYCCGVYEKNQMMAQTLRSSILRGQNYDICFYDGSISIPDPFGQRTSIKTNFSFFSGKTISRRAIKEVKSTIKADISPEINDDLPFRPSIKIMDSNFFGQECRDKRREAYLKRIMDSRKQRQQSNRTSLDVQDITCLVKELSI